MENEGYVKSIFKDQVLTKEEYTRKWIELIRVLESQKSKNGTGE